MKKQYLAITLNIVLILGIVAALGFTIIKSTSAQNKVEENKVATYAQATYQENLFTIGVVQRADNEESNKCFEGLIAGLASRGYVNSNNITIKRIVEKDGDKCSEEIQNLIDQKVDLLYTIGPSASVKAMKLTKDIPIVFAAVGDPESYGLVESNETPGKNVTGVSNFYPVFELIDSIKLITPNAKSIGAIYDETIVYSTTQVNTAKMQAGTDKNNMILNKYPISKSSEITEQLERIKDDGMDIIYLPVDSTVYDDIGEIVDFSNKYNIPIYAGNLLMMKEGCFSATETNYTSIGKKAADVIVDVVVNGKDVSKMPVIYKYKCDSYVSQKGLDTFNISLSREAKKEVKIAD